MRVETAQSVQPAALSLTELPTCALRVGVTGHRPPYLTNEQAAEIRKTVRIVLHFVQSSVEKLVRAKPGYAEHPPILRIVSSLAEGADRLVAEEGLELGFHLQCPLPAARDDYRRDFQSPASAAAYDELLDAADAVVELNGRRSGEWLDAAAYEASGRMVLAHCDLLIAIWDGERGKQGGTGQIAGKALRADIPVIRISPKHPDAAEYLTATGAPLSNWRDELRHAIGAALTPPSAIAAPIARFLGESPDPSAGQDPIGGLRDHADRIAQHYASLYRRAYRRLYTLAPLAVFFAIAVLWLSANRMESVPEWPFSAAELLCIVVILSVIVLGRRGHWHERWLNARVLTEQFRTWAYLAPLAQSPPTSRVPPYLAVHTRDGDWTGWYFRARVRQRGLRSLDITPDYLAAYQRELLEIVTGQAEHHRHKGEPRKQVHERVELASTVLFAITGVLCLVHLAAPALLNWSSALVLTTLAAATAVLPSVAAALDGFQAQGEYQRLSERSEGMADYFEALRKQIPDPDTRRLSYAELAQLAYQASAVMLDEISDWRNLVRIRILHTV